MSVLNYIFLLLMPVYALFAYNIPNTLVLKLTTLTSVNVYYTITQPILLYYIIKGSII